MLNSLQDSIFMLVRDENCEKVYLIFRPWLRDGKFYSSAAVDAYGAVDGYTTFPVAYTRRPWDEVMHLKGFLSRTSCIPYAYSPFGATFTPYNDIH